MFRAKFLGGPLGGSTMTVFGYHKDGVGIPCNEFKHGVLNCDENGRLRMGPTFIYHTYLIKKEKLISEGKDSIHYEYHYQEGR